MSTNPTERTIPVGLEANQICVTERNALSSGESAALDQLPHLTPREIDLLRLLLRGLPVRLIAYQLRVTCRTARTYSYMLMRKLGTSDRTALLRLGASWLVAFDREKTAG